MLKIYCFPTILLSAGEKLISILAITHLMLQLVSPVKAKKLLIFMSRNPQVLGYRVIELPLSK